MACLSVDPPLSHVTTFGGHPVCCAAGLASLEVIVRENLPAQAASLGERLRRDLRALGERHGGIREVRGKGLLIGVEFGTAERTRAFAAAAFARGVIVGWTLHSDRVIRLAPPLNISEAEYDQALRALEVALSDTA
jgi:putrescine aminotransferase